jgi:hypothetical protein
MAKREVAATREGGLTRDVQAPIAALGNDTIVVLGEGLSGFNLGDDRQVALARVSPAGAVANVTVGLATDPEGLVATTLSVRGNEAVLAWIGGVAGYPGRIGLARASLP